MGRKKDKKSGKMPDTTTGDEPAGSAGYLSANTIRIAAVLLAVVILAGAVFFGSSLLHTSSSPEVAVNQTNITLTATFFYGNGCSHCEKVKPLLADIQVRYPELSIERLEIYDNRTNLKTFQDMGSRYGLSSTGLIIPTIFIGENVLVGDTEIKDHFEEYILAEKQRNATGNPPR